MTLETNQDLTKESSGIIFKTIKLKNFMSFGNIWSEINLEDIGTTLLIGENLDIGGSSGAGKSTLVNAISFCLYDKIPSGVSKDKLINRTNDKKNTLMEINLSFSKGTDEYLIRRWRGSSTGVELLMNGKDITPASVSRGEDSFNSKVEEIIGFSYNLFSQIILFNGNSQPFLDLSVGAQRSLIEELFKITILSQKAITLKKMSSETDKQISVQKALIQQQEKQNESYNKHLQEALDRVNKWESSNQSEINDLCLQLESLSNVDFDSEEKVLQEISSYTEELSNLRFKLRELNLEKQNRQKESSPKESQLTISKSNLSTLEKNVLSLEKELVHLKDAKCPYCLQDFKDSATKISELESKQSTTISDINSLKLEIDVLEKETLEFETKKTLDIEDISSKISSITDEILLLKDNLDTILNTLQFKDLPDLIKAKNNLSTLQEKIEDSINSSNPHTEAYESLLSEGETKIDTSVLDELIKLQEHQQFLLKLLTDKNSFIRKNIISKTIPFLNKRIAYYTEKLNLPHIVIFQPDMSCEITQIGRDLDHGNLSNGEKKKLNLSLCLAFRDVLTYLHSKINVLFTDEVDGGSISGGDVDNLINVIKNKAWDDKISIFIISHRPEFEGRCDRNLIIRKEGGFSNVLLQPED